MMLLILLIHYSNTIHLNMLIHQNLLLLLLSSIHSFTIILSVIQIRCVLVIPIKQNNSLIYYGTIFTHHRFHFLAMILSTFFFDSFTSNDTIMSFDSFSPNDTILSFDSFNRFDTIRVCDYRLSYKFTFIVIVYHRLPIFIWEFRFKIWEYNLQILRMKNVCMTVYISNWIRYWYT